MVCYTNPPPTAPKQLAEKVAELSQHMEKQQQQQHLPFCGCGV